MRVTNLMITRGMLGNIMTNKADMNKKYEQYATRQKIQNPSDDPVVAIRALKYRSNLSELEQYRTKNVEDAASWMDATESALTNMNDLLTELYDKCVAGASDTYETIDRDSMEQSLLNSKEEIYRSMNADNAGRYLFSGYRTNTSVCYTKDDSSKKYTITEPLSFQNLYEKTYVKGGAEYDTSKTAEDYKKEAPTTDKAYVLDLGYKDLASLNKLTVTDKNGAEVTFTIATKNSTDADCYTAGTNTVNFIADTGQIVISDDLYETFRTAKSVVAEYDKTNFKTGDVRPEMYYDCTSVELDSTGNPKADTQKTYTKPEEQDIKYDVNFGQQLKVNVLANETINSSYARAIDNILDALNDAYNTQSEIENVNLLMSDSNKSPDEIAALSTLKEQLETELTLKKSILRESFASAQTATKNAQNGTKVPYINENGETEVKKISVSIATTSIGSRSARLKMIQTRLEDLKINFTDLRDTNEVVDLEEALVNYTAAQTAYNAALNAAGRMVQNSLLDFL